MCLTSSGVIVSETSGVLGAGSALMPDEWGATIADKRSASSSSPRAVASAMEIGLGMVRLSGANESGRFSGTLHYITAYPARAAYLNLCVDHS